MTEERGRIVWITGASSGIGFALAEVFAMEKDRVYATARNRRKLQSLLRNVEEQGAHVEIRACDVTKPGHVKRVVKTILRSANRIDVLINNAGITYFKDFLSTTEKEFSEVVSTNLNGFFHTTRAVLPGMIKRKSGLIINVLSHAAKQTYTLSAAYSASKAGAEAMMNVLREESRSDGIKVLNVFPGAIHTPMWSPRHRRMFRNQMIQSEELARLIYQASLQENNVMIEELLVRPQVGDLKV